RYSAELQRTAPVVDSASMDFLTAYTWPGNIRELGNVARKIALFGDVRTALNDLRDARADYLVNAEEPRSSLKAASRAASHKTEREMILTALSRTNWNRKQAARDLQISYKSLLHKIKALVQEKHDAEVGH